MLGDFLRYASPNEQRTISREDLGCYHAVIIGATYQFRDGFSVTSPHSYVPGLRRCVAEHPYLRVIVGDAHTDKAFYKRIASVNLEDHIRIVKIGTGGNDHMSQIEEVLRSHLDMPFRQGIPPWRIAVLPLSSSRSFISFEYSHTIGDGPSGAAFHRMLLQFYQDTENSEQAASPVMQTQGTILPAPFDTPQRLPISWSLLLGPLLSHYLPTFLTEYMRLSKGIARIDDGTWTGATVPMDCATSCTKIKLYEIEPELLENVLRISRAHETRFTGAFQQLVTKALCKVIPDPGITNFISQTSINMRGAIGVSNDEMGEFVSGAYISHFRGDTSMSPGKINWKAASAATHQLSVDSSRLHDQSIGLLRYLTSIRGWMVGKLGQRRDCSFEVSNIGAVEASSLSTGGERAQTQIINMVFAQPGHLLSAPLAFNLISVKGGSFVYTITWKVGALGVATCDEDHFVEMICQSINSDLKSLN
ncbi:alcohol acetyltransferase [Xylariales sp. PMI_506]|nr:alcohol acetyltransferase [Xylariales sp. PMI_506]